MRTSQGGNLGVVVVHPRGDPRRRIERFSSALLPLAWGYGAASRLVRDVQLRRARPLPGSPHVISVGNLEVGGSGKTPFAIHLLRHLRERGEGAVYVSRGYRSRAERVDGVTVVPPRGVRAAPLPGVRLVRRDDPGLAGEIGDEGAVVALQLPDVPLLLGRRKSDAVACAARMFAPDYAVLDDAFQSWGVHRDVDVVIVGAGTAPEGARLLPAGPMREEPDAPGRADVALVGGLGPESDLERAAAALRRHAKQRASFAGLTRRLRFDGGAAPDGPVAALSAIGQPGGFERMLTQAGCDVCVSIRYPDHHRYSEADGATIERVASAHGARTIITTEKDAVKLRALAPLALPLCAPRLEMVLSDETVLEKMRKPRRDAAASA